MPQTDPTPAGDREQGPAELPLNDPRRATRRSFRRLFHCRLSPAGGGPDLSAMVANYCAWGLGLMASRRLELGAGVVFRAAAAGPERPALDFPGRVTHCEDNGAGWFAVGVEFDPPLTDDERRSLLARIG